MDTNNLIKHRVGNVDVYAAESVEMLVDHWKNKVAELEEYNQQLQSMKMWNDKAESKAKADAIREAIAETRKNAWLQAESEPTVICKVSDLEEFISDLGDGL